MDKQNVAYVYKGILGSLKKKENSVTWLNLEGIMLSEISQTQKHKYFDSTYVRCVE